MAIRKPTIRIDNFTGMGDDGPFWLDGFRPKKYGGQSVLQQTGGSVLRISEDTSGYTGFTPPYVMTDFRYGADSVIFGIDSVGHIWAFDQDYTSYDLGKVHTWSGTGSGTDQTFFIWGPDMIQTKSGHLLYSSANHLGVGFIGQAKSGSGSTKIVDKDGRNLSTLGASSSAGSNKLFNLTKKEEYTITSVSTTDATNDTLNFSAGSTTPAANDYYIFFVDNKFKFDTNISTNNHYVGQDESIYWERPIIRWNDAYYILNGNWISTLAQDDSTWTSDILTEEHKQLPDATQAIGMSYNQDKMIVLFSEANMGGILLWDGYSSGWISRINTNTPPAACVRYKTGWIVTIGGTLYYTDGYSIEPITTIPDSERYTIVIGRERIKVYNDKVYVLISQALDTSRIKNGLWIYDLINGGWHHRRMHNGSGTTNGCTTLFNSLVRSYNTTSQQMFVAGEDGGSATKTYFVAKTYDTSVKKSSAIFLVKLPQKMSLSLVGLQVTPYINAAQTGTGTATISVNYGDGNQPLFFQYNPGTASTTTVLKVQPGDTYPAKVGQLIEMQNGDQGGERAYITEIANAGTNTEQLTISPALSGTPDTSAEYCRYNLYSAGSKTVSNYDIDGELIYSIPGFYSDKLFIEVFIDASNGYAFDLLGINIY